MDQFGEDWSVEFLDPDPPPGVDSAEWSVEHLDNPQSFPAEPLEEETPDWFESFITKHELQDEDMPDANCGSLLLDRHEPLGKEMPEATSNDSGVLNIGRFLGNSNNETPHSSHMLVNKFVILPENDRVNTVGFAKRAASGQYRWAKPTSSNPESSP
ncbi:regulator of chromosome condensation [Culex quinquefasciatus]|uniref:Regulator of chromosome condensation n=1 Tax=Culex quinquefasciatus TaxID=7176 RepID=B0XIZ8_CULQU|nr:regulator of chromosome condensation [Culex quinquefasciatus]|eukprot:XP_001869620.1 regulator of chromosome condensation [Culex quinquefasciatus]